MRGACIRLSRMMPVPLRLPHNYTPVFFNTLQVTRYLQAINQDISWDSMQDISRDISQTARRTCLCYPAM